MTNRLIELADEVRILELEVRKLELEDRVTQLKAERSIDDECVGCAGPCMAVDVAAKLQEELDECNKLALNESRRVQCDTELIEKLHIEIKQERDENIGLSETIDRMAKKWSVDRAIIKNFKILETRETDRLHRIIEDLDSQLTEKCAIIEEITRLRVDEVETRQGIEAELSARKEDSRVLMRVVEIVKNWDDSTGRAFPTLTQMLDELADYIDAPEVPPETPIDESREITIGVFLELP